MKTSANGKMLLLIACVLAACGDDGMSDGVPGDFFVSGSITGVGGAEPPASAKAVILWHFEAPSGDYLYKWGEGMATASSFTIGVNEPLPPRVTSDGLVGFGWVVLLPTSYALPDGVVLDESLEESWLGLAGEYAILYRGSAYPTEGSWFDQFPVGLSCGKCVESTVGFDTYMPIECSEVRIQVGPDDAIFECNPS